LIKINEVVIVEGKYDKIKLSSIIDAVIIETNGFSIYKDKEQLELIRRLAAAKGILIITDSDAAGFKIRNFLSGAIPKGQVKHAYIPDIFGKEKRKTQVSKEGKLGVEGVPKSTILKSLENAGVLCAEISEPSKKITKTDLFEDGLTGGERSSQRRQKLLKSLNLPMRLSTNSMLEVLNAMMDFEEYKRVLREI
jgi:ribonuclease M5